MLYFVSLQRLQIFFPLHTLWLSLSLLFVFLSLVSVTTRFKALLLTLFFAVLFSSGALSSTVFQPIFALPIVFLFLLFATECMRYSSSLGESIFLVIMGIFATMLHYSNAVLLVVLLPLIFILQKLHSFSAKKIFLLVLGLYALAISGLGLLNWQKFIANLTLLSWSGNLYFNFAELVFCLIVANLALLYFVSVPKLHRKAFNFLFISSVLFLVVFCIPSMLELIGIVPRMYYILTAVLAGIFFLLHGIAVLFSGFTVDLFWERVFLCSIIGVVAILMSLNTTVLKLDDIKNTSSFLIAEYMAHRYFTNQIPFHITVSQFCGDTSNGSWFSGGIWLFFEKITGEKAICLEPTGQNFHECFSKPVSQVYYVCQEHNPDYSFSENVTKVFETEQGWQVFLLP